MSTYAYARTASGHYLGSLSDGDGEQRASVPVVLDDSSNVHANTIINDVESESRPQTAESAPAISSKSPPAMSDKPLSSVNPAQNIDTGDAAPAHSQSVSSHDEPAARQRGPAVKVPLRHPQSPLATSHTAAHMQETTTTTTTTMTADIPSLIVVGSTPITPTAPESFGRPQPQDDRTPLTGRSSPANDRDRRQSRRRSVMDVSFPTVFQ